MTKYRNVLWLALGLLSGCAGTTQPVDQVERVNTAHVSLPEVLASDAAPSSMMVVLEGLFYGSGTELVPGLQRVLKKNFLEVAEKYPDMPVLVQATEGDPLVEPRLIALREYWVAGGLAAERLAVRWVSAD